MSNRLEVLPQYGKWGVVAEVAPRRNKTGTPIRHIHVRCACGVETVVKFDTLHRGRSLGCRTCARVRHHPPVGTVFGDLTLVEVGIALPGRNTRYFRLRCTCGTEKHVLPAHLASGMIQSCGCRKRRVGQANPRYKGCGSLTGSHLKSIEGMARKRGLSFTVTKEYLWALFLRQDQKCALTDIPLYMRPSNGKGTASLDRIDSDKGYEEGNVQWVHKKVNKMKWELSQEEFLALCGAVVRHKGDGPAAPTIIGFMAGA